jgi:hypothetical protein
MEASPNQHTIHPKDLEIISHIDQRIADYEAYLALDHELALQGLETATMQLKEQRDGYDTPA